MHFARHGFTVHALSLRGHGASPGREQLRWTRLADYVADVARVAASLPTPPVVIGHSMGGLVVQHYLAQHPAPAAVLLASAPVDGVWRTTLRTALRYPLALLKVNLRFSLFPLVATPSMARAMLFSSAMPAEQVAAYAGRLQDESYRAFLDMLMLDLPQPQRVTTPMLVLGAARDAIFAPPEVRRTAAAYGTEALIFPEMGHDMMLEPHWQLAADRVVNWLGARGL